MVGRNNFCIVSPVRLSPASGVPVREQRHFLIARMLARTERLRLTSDNLIWFSTNLNFGGRQRTQFVSRKSEKGAVA
jgi:hypothetical protein